MAFRKPRWEDCNKFQAYMSFILKPYSQNKIKQGKERMEEGGGGLETFECRIHHSHPTQWRRQLGLGRLPGITKPGIQTSMLSWEPPNPPLTNPTLPFRGQNVTPSLKSKSLFFEQHRGKSWLISSVKTFTPPELQPRVENEKIIALFLCCPLSPCPAKPSDAGYSQHHKCTAKLRTSFTTARSCSGFTEK